MSQLQTADKGSASSSTFEEVGSGLNVYECSGIVEGRVRWLDSPEDVIGFAQSGEDVSDVIVVVRGGTTTFLTMALNAGIRGVITLQGAPESHLGIIAREYGIPCIMSVKFSKGIRTSRGETIPADGVRVRLDVTKRPNGTVSVEPGAPVDNSPAPDAGPGMPPDQLAQIMALLANFLGKTPHGPAGDAEMRATMKTRVLYLDDESSRRDLTIDEVNELIHYYRWNEWDALAARATEGESGLIPRQEYEAMGIMNCWFKHPAWMEVIDRKVGVDGMIAIGDRARHEIGTKINLLHLWAMATAPSFGRGIALELKLHDLDYRANEIAQTFTRVRRLYKGLWGGGEMLSSMREYRAPILDSSWVLRFTKDRIALADDKARSTFQRFNGATELLGFLLHFDNRLGLGDTGPYPTTDGGFVLVRDLFINEPAFPWSEATKGLPYAVTIAMFFEPGADLKMQFTDLSTVFSQPANYLPYVEGVAAYSRETFDTPMSELKTLSLADMAKLQTEAEQKAEALYKRIAKMTQREKIEAGAMVYTAGFVLPVARAAGVYDELVKDHGFLEAHPAVAACYTTIISGVAKEMIPRLFLTGSWGNPVPAGAAAHRRAADPDFPVFHALQVRGLATADAIAETSGLGKAAVEKVLAAATEKGHVKALKGKVPGNALTPAGNARYVLLRSDAVSKATIDVLTPVYDAFLEPNRKLKQLLTDYQLKGPGSNGSSVTSRLDAIQDQMGALLERATRADAHFASYEPRLERALVRFKDGDATALAKPLSGSYHDVWMELHQDLLVTLGRARSEHDE